MLAVGAISGKEVSVTLWGDLAAFAAALMIVLHWQIGQKLRRCVVFVCVSVWVGVGVRGMHADGCLLLLHKHSLLFGTFDHNSLQQSDHMLHYTKPHPAAPTFLPSTTSRVAPACCLLPLAAPAAATATSLCLCTVVP